MLHCSKILIWPFTIPIFKGFENFQIFRLNDGPINLPTNKEVPLFLIEGDIGTFKGVLTDHNTDGPSDRQTQCGIEATCHRLKLEKKLGDGSNFSIAY